MSSRLLASAAIVAMLGGTSCARTAQSASKVGGGASASSSERGRNRDLGAQCIPYGKSFPEGPKSYLVSDIGKRGVPKPDESQRDAIRTIGRYVHSATLRFVEDPFVVFDAKLGPCLDAAGGYPMLNGSCWEFYEPGENPYTTLPAPDEICPKYPWTRR